MSGAVNADGAFVWNGQIHINPPGSVQQLPSIIVGGKMTDSAWQSRAPKSNNLDVVKLTKENFVSVAKGLVRKYGPEIQVFSNYFTYATSNTGQTFTVGDFLVKYYDYEFGIEHVRLATLEERKKYDLR